MFCKSKMMALGLAITAAHSEEHTMALTPTTEAPSPLCSTPKAPPASPVLSPRRQQEFTMEERLSAPLMQRDGQQYMQKPVFQGVVATDTHKTGHPKSHLSQCLMQIVRNIVDEQSTTLYAETNDPIALTQHNPMCGRAARIITLWEGPSPNTHELIRQAFDDAKTCMNNPKERFCHIQSLMYLLWHEGDLMREPIVAQAIGYLAQNLNRQAGLPHIPITQPKNTLGEHLNDALSTFYRQKLGDTTINGVSYTTNDCSLARKIEAFSMHHMNLRCDSTPLCKVMQRHGSDKSSIRHNYTQLYHFLFGDMRQKPLTLLECGIGSVDPQYSFTMAPIYEVSGGKPGASLRGWRDYFKKARIIGVDIDETILFTEKRIACYKVDQMDPQSIRSFLDQVDLPFHIVIDDGYHDYEAQSRLLLAVMPHVAPDGLYLIEDVRGDQIPHFTELLSHGQYAYPHAIVRLPVFSNDYDNNIVIVLPRNRQ